MSINSWRRAAPALAVLLALAGPVAVRADGPRVLILAGRMDPSHNWRETTPVLRSILEESGCEVRVAAEPAELEEGALGAADAVVVHYNGPRFGAAMERAIEEFVRSGKGLVSLHGVSYGPFFGMRREKGGWHPTAEGGWPEWPALLGATWKPENIGHGARHVFTVRWVDREHPIARGLEESFTADDELYHRMDLRPEARVLAAAFSDPQTHGTGHEEPIVWTVAYGAGRTVHLTLGHDARALGRPGVAAAIARAAGWAAGRLR